MYETFNYLESLHKFVSSKFSNNLSQSPHTSRYLPCKKEQPIKYSLTTLDVHSFPILYTCRYIYRLLKCLLFPSRDIGCETPRSQTSKGMTSEALFRLLSKMQLRATRNLSSSRTAAHRTQQSLAPNRTHAPNEARSHDKPRHLECFQKSNLNSVTFIFFNSRTKAAWPSSCGIHYGKLTYD